MLHCEQSEEVKSQVAFADVILLNKVDLATPTELDMIERRIRAMNGLAKIRRVRMADVPVGEVLDLGGFDLDRALAVKPGFLDPEYPFEGAQGYGLAAGEYSLELDDGPDPTMRVAMLATTKMEAATLAADGETALRAFTQNPVFLAPQKGALVPGLHLWTLRLEAPGRKSFNVRVPKAGCYTFYTEHLPEEFAMRLVDSGGREVTPSCTHQFTAGHSHDEEVRSVSFEFEGTIDGDKMNEWLGRLLKTRGADIFRMKGILNIRGEAERFVFQGVHMLFDGKAGGPWGSAWRGNRLVFIGRNLDRAELERDFRACAA
jgi:G3E family GTPase